MKKNRLIHLMADYHVRTGKRLSLSELARTAGISRPTMRKYIKNEAEEYNITALYKLVELFELNSVDDIFVSGDVSEDIKTTQPKGKVA